MSKRESTFFNMVSTLFVIALVSSVTVGSVYEVTKEPIAQAQLAKKTNAIKDVVPEFDNSPIDDKYTADSDVGPLNMYPAKKDGKLIGTAIETMTNQGFGGTVKLMVGLLPDGQINKIEVIEHTETPGLGDKMEKNKSNFIKQFEGKNPAQFKLVVKKDGGDVDAITAATISSRAFCDAVKRAYNVYKQ
jgi:electron transport complex protein RnfG